MPDNKLGEFVHNRRVEKDLSLRDLGKLCDISHTHIDSIEKGVDFRTKKPVRITLETLTKLAQGLDVDVQTLIDLSLENTPTPVKDENFTPAERKKIDEEAARIRSLLMASVGTSFEGEIEDEETLEKVMAVLTKGLEMARKDAKEKFTPKKYRQNKQ